MPSPLTAELEILLCESMITYHSRPIHGSHIAGRREFARREVQRYRERIAELSVPVVSLPQFSFAAEHAGGEMPCDLGDLAFPATLADESPAEASL